MRQLREIIMLANKETLPVSQKISVYKTQDKDRQQNLDWMIAEEVPVAFIYNAEPFAVMMSTPDNLIDFAIGFSLSEEIVTCQAAIEDIYIDVVENGIRVFISIDENLVGLGWKVKRTVAGRTSCGLCGIAELDGAVRTTSKKLKRGFSPSVKAIMKSMESFKQKQELFQSNRSVHGAAFCSKEGDVLLLREDVGRHNALDKLLGRLVTSNFNPLEGYIIMSSRCSFELIKKASTMGVSALITMSAPTGLALSMARSSNMFLASLAGAEGLVVYVE